MPLTSRRRLRRPVSAAPESFHRCDRFERLAAWTVRLTGGRHGFWAAVLMYLAWAASGPFFGFGEAWRTLFFLATSSVTFLTVFLARNAQIRSSKALHLKLDELIYAANKADNALIEAENFAETALDQMRERNRGVATYAHPRSDA